MSRTHWLLGILLGSALLGGCWLCNGLVRARQVRTVADMQVIVTKLENMLEKALEKMERDHH